MSSGDKSVIEAVEPERSSRAGGRVAGEVGREFEAGVGCEVGCEL